MSPLPHTLKLSLIACSVPSAIIALIATLGAQLQWGGLNFSNPIYYATLAVAAWCPASKLVAWRLFRHEAELCPICLPAKSIQRHLSAATNTAGKPISEE